MMQHNSRAILLAGALLLVGQSAWADDGPLLFPTKDVTVLYKLTGASQLNGAQKLQVTYGDQGRVRMEFFRFVEEKHPFAWLIFDPPHNRVLTVLPEKQGYLERDTAGLFNPGRFLNERMNLTRQGTATIVGFACTDWRVFNGIAGEGSACVTDDGVVLRATRNKPTDGLMQALEVHYVSDPSGTFDPPADFKLILSEPSQQGLPAKPR
jgi:hypothetical protein